MVPGECQNLLNELIKKVLQRAYKLTGAGSQLVETSHLEFPKDKSFGDISTSIALKMSALLKRPPREIAGRVVSFLQEDISKVDLGAFVENISVAGVGFINFRFTPEYFHSFLRQVIRDKGVRIGEIKDKKNILVEFVSANPTGPLSVAHGRQAAVGDVLCNILEWLGHKVTREYYLNDEGNQINILGDSIYLRLKQLGGEKVELAEDRYQGEYIIDLARELLKAEDARAQSAEYCREYGIKRILEIIEKELSDFGVEFDSWYSQASLRESGKIERAISFLRENGFIYEQEGAVWFASSRFGDDKDRVIVKSDGTYTYLAPDIAYHQNKYERGFDRLINLWGPDHHGYIPRLKAAVEALGKKRDSMDVVIVQLATLFKQGKVISMSTRKGEYITLKQVLDEVGADSARFFFLMRKTDSHLDFDLELAKRQSSENPVYYVQYAYARICNILANTDFSECDREKADLSLLKEKEELDLLRVLERFEHTLKIAEIQLDPYSLTSYLQEAAESFHRFYDIHRVLSDDECLKYSRLCLISGVRIMLSLGLKLLGVKAPEKM